MELSDAWVVETIKGGLSRRRSFFFNDHGRKVIDVACGDMFTCVIVVETEEVPIKQGSE